jgi:protein involved in polysaccharide export with SLBB domain
MPSAIRKPRLAARAAAAGALACLLAGLGALAPTAGAQTPTNVPPMPPPTDTGLVERNVGVLRPGDVLEIVVWGAEELSNKFLIDARGYVQIPGLGEVRAAGLSPVEVKAGLRQALVQRGYANPELSLQPLIRVYVLGEVRQPGLQLVDPGTSLLQLVTIAGGPTSQANLAEARVVREGQSYSVDLESALRGSATGRIVLYSNDYVVIPQRTGWTRENVAFFASTLGAVVTIANLIITLSQ